MVSSHFFFRMLLINCCLCEMFAASVVGVSLYYQTVPDVVQSMFEECLCDAVPHSVLVHRALIAGDHKKAICYF